MITFGSLFTGLAGLDMAVEEATGWELAWQVENDEFCMKILERHWPDVRRYGDIREIDWRNVEPVELICGGFPCQPFSVAGQNRGEDDERNMWPETYRAIRELGPRYVFLENVPGLLAHGYFGRILGDLAQGGYDAVWDTFTAAEVGAPQRRERLFILAYAGREHEHVQQPPARSEPTGKRKSLGHPEGEFGQRRPEPAGRAGQALPGCSGATVADAAGSRQRTGLRDDDAGQPDAAGRFPRVADTESEQMGTTRLSWQSAGFPPGPDDRAAWARVLAEVPALEPAVCRVATGIPDRTHRLRALGNAVVPAQGAYALRTLWERMMA